MAGRRIQRGVGLIMNTRHFWFSFFLVICRTVLGGIFITAAVFKIPNAGEFAREIANYKMPLPVEAINLTAVILPWVELIAGVFLIFGLWQYGQRSVIAVPGWLGRFSWFFYRNFQKGSLVILCGLLLFFNILLAITIFRGIDISCGCFGPLSAQKVGWMKIFENVFFALCAVPAFIALRSKGTGDEPSSGEQGR